MENKPESSGAEKPEINLKDIDLSVVGASIKKYNDQFNGGTILANEILFSMGEGKGNINIEEGRMASLVEIKERHRAELEATGLGFEPVRGLATLYGSKGEIKTSEMRINLIDGQRFIAYLAALSSETLTNSQTNGLVLVADSLTKQLAFEYDLTNPDDTRMLELFSSLGGIIDRLHELDPKNDKGLVDSMEKLEKYLDVAKKKYLKEYLSAENGGLLDEIGGRNFGPSQWQCDSTPESYKNRYWFPALKKVADMSKNPNVREFQLQLIGHLKRSLAFAKKDLPELYKDRINQEKEDKKNPDIVIFREMTSERAEKEIEEYRIAMDEVYEELEAIEERLKIEK